MVLWGYYFLENVGRDYGFLADTHFGWTSSSEWNTIPEEQKQRYINHYYPGVRQQAERILGWLEMEKIRVNWQEADYTDDRSPAEQEAMPIADAWEKWFIPKIAPSPTPSLAVASVTKAARTKKWWQFWK